MRVEEISLGSMYESIAHPREVFRPALIYSAFAVILAHNHPSGDPSPERRGYPDDPAHGGGGQAPADQLLDHVIIGAPAEGRLPYYSFKEAGVLLENSIRFRFVNSASVRLL